MKLISKTDNCPVPRGGYFQEVRTYDDNGKIRTKTITKRNFQGRPTGWDEWVEKQPFDDEK